MAGIHVAAGGVHRFDDVIQANHRTLTPVQGHLTSAGGLDRSNGVALDARHLHLAAHRVAGQAGVVFHADLCRHAHLLRVPPSSWV